MHRNAPNALSTPLRWRRLAWRNWRLCVFLGSPEDVVWRLRVRTPRDSALSDRLQEMAYAVIGAGMVGCATALALSKRGFKVVIYEQREDPRLETSKEAGRSINLAISARGLRSLRAIDPQLCEAIRSEIVPMTGRMVHSKQGEMFGVTYGLSGTESINSIGRSLLNNLMISAAEKAGVEIRFGAKAPTKFHELKRLGSTVFGCDGTYSKVREIVARQVDSRLDMETVKTHYIEVPIEAAAATHWPRNYLHVWPRGAHMFIALPNADGSFTGTLFAPRELVRSQLASPGQFAQWFSGEFPDAAAVVGQHALLRVAEKAPVGKLTSVKFSPYNVGSDVVLLGDASHSMVPFYGQGLNAGLEDVRVLFEEFIDRKYPDPADWEKAFDEYSVYRKPDLDAINDLSMANYLEMSSSVTTSAFQLRKKLDNALARVLGDRWLPLYTMVSFRDDIRYSTALASSKWQQGVIGLLSGSLTVGLLAVAGGALVCAKRHMQ